MKKTSRKLIVYELHNKSIIISSTWWNSVKNKFIQNTQRGLGRAFSDKISDEELGKQIRFYMEKSQWKYDEEKL